jgi:hypothetical protein
VYIRAPCSGSAALSTASARPHEAVTASGFRWRWRQGQNSLLGRLIDVELSIRGILRGFGPKVGPVTRKGFEARIRQLVTGQATLERIAAAMLSARATLKTEYDKLHKTVAAPGRAER